MNLRIYLWRCEFGFVLLFAQTYRYLAGFSIDLPANCLYGVTVCVCVFRASTCSRSVLGCIIASIIFIANLSIEGIVWWKSCVCMARKSTHRTPETIVYKNFQIYTTNAEINVVFAGIVSSEHTAPCTLSVFELNRATRERSHFFRARR